MASFNKVILLGNLTRDPQVRYIPSGSAVAEIGLAVNRTWWDKNTNSRKEEVTFVDVTLWGRTAEIAGEYLAKGRSVLIEGYLHLDQWDDKETGQKRSKLKVVAENMTMVGGREGGAGGPPGGGQRGGQGESGGGGRQGGERPPQRSAPPASGGGQSSYGGPSGGGQSAGYASGPPGGHDEPSYGEPAGGSNSGGGDDEVPF